MARWAVTVTFLQKTQAGQETLDDLRPYLFNHGHMQGAGTALGQSGQPSHCGHVCQVSIDSLGATLCHLCCQRPFGFLMCRAPHLYLTQAVKKTKNKQPASCELVVVAIDPGSVCRLLGVIWIPYVLCISSLPHTSWCGKARQL